MGEREVKDSGRKVRDAAITAEWVELRCCANGGDPEEAEEAVRDPEARSLTCRARCV